MTSLRRITVLLASLLALSVSGCGQPKPSDAFGQKVRAYLLEHPEVLQEAYERLQAKQQTQKLAASTTAIHEHRQVLERDPRDFVANPDGKVTVVEFFDYNCGYCKLIAPEVLALVQANPDVRFVFKDFTIFGEASEYAAAGADLAKPTGKYLTVYRQFMAQKPLDDDGIVRILAANGLDGAGARSRQNTADHKRYLADVHQLAVDLGIEGTPAFIIGDTLIPGADPQALREAIAAAKKART